jgi:uncharacterized membrane protein
MTDSSGWTPPAPPGGSPPAPPGAPPPGGPSGPPAWGTPYAPARPTNSLAIVSLVAGCAQFVVCPIIGAVVAIITGHISRRQIRKTGEQGGGMALAGLILGYIGIALTALAVAGLLVFLFGFADDVAQHAVRDDARRFGEAIAAEARLDERTSRDPSLLRRVYTQESTSSGCCDDDRIRLADGTRVEFATRDDWERAGWRLEFERTIVYSEYACLTIPESTAEVPTEVDGKCLAAG